MNKFIYLRNDNAGCYITEMRFSNHITLPLPEREIYASTQHMTPWFMVIHKNNYIFR